MTKKQPLKRSFSTLVPSVGGVNGTCKRGSLVELRTQRRFATIHLHLAFGCQDFRCIFVKNMQLSNCQWRFRLLIVFAFLVWTVHGGLTPYTPNTRPLLEGLPALKPQTLAIMRGSSYSGDGAQALLDLDGVMKESLSVPSRR